MCLAYKSFVYKNKFSNTRNFFGRKKKRFFPKFGILKISAVSAGAIFSVAFCEPMENTQKAETIEEERIGNHSPSNMQLKSANDVRKVPEVRVFKIPALLLRFFAAMVDISLAIGIGSLTYEALKFAISDANAGLISFFTGWACLELRDLLSSKGSFGKLLFGLKLLSFDTGNLLNFSQQYERIVYQVILHILALPTFGADFWFILFNEYDQTCSESLSRVIVVEDEDSWLRKDQKPTYSSK